MSNLTKQVYPLTEKDRTNSIPFHCVVELQYRDYLEVYVKNKSGTNNITLDNINVIVTEL